MMTSERAAFVLRGVEKNELVVEAEEIEELLGLGLAVEADRDDLALVQWLQPVVRGLTTRDVGDPLAILSLETTLENAQKDLASDWYRMTRSREKCRRRERDRIAIRRALVLLRDKTLISKLAKIVAEAPLLAPNARWVCCPVLGAEHYALTHKGWRVSRSLNGRLERFRNAPFKTFLRTFEKTEGKMRAFGMEVAILTRGIGPVRKNPHQIVIGLAKAGPAAHALSAYHVALRDVLLPDVAVTCARNTAQFGSPANAAARLRYAQAAMKRAGIPDMGTAKMLLAFDPPDAGLLRFADLMRHLDLILGVRVVYPTWTLPGDFGAYKYAARLMPAHGSPADVVARVATALNLLLNQIPSRANPSLDPRLANRFAAVVLASMVKAPEALPELVKRFREVAYELHHAGPNYYAESDALDCVACPGSPAAVIDTITALLEQIAPGRPPERGDVAIAVAFAKRFAY